MRKVIIFAMLLVGIMMMMAGGHFLKEGDGERVVSAETLTKIHATVDDFYLPGTQPGALTDTIDAPSQCTFCHINYNNGPQSDPVEDETIRAWTGSMMAQAGRDPLFWAALDVANANIEEVGGWCLRCHTPKAYFEGRVTVAGGEDGSQLVAGDFDGVECEVCHRMVDPVASAENPVEDTDVLAAITPSLTHIGNGAMVFDPLDRRRGPFDVVGELGHNPHQGFLAGNGETIQSPYHEEAALCGSCHDISNPLLQWDAATQSYLPNAAETPADDLTELFPVERTYSEWLLSDYNSAEGIYAPQFGGNKDHVSTCQDCHMRDISGIAAVGGTHRDNLPLHDLTGANTWIPKTLPLHPVFGAHFNDQDNANALLAGIDRAKYNLENAATLTLSTHSHTLNVQITNETGHKLPTGYPEGRRMWLQIEGYDAQNQLIYTSGAYAVATGDLTYDADIKIYEIQQGLTDGWAAQLGLAAGPTFHFALNNMVVHDNRIPPRGYNYAAFLGRGAAPVTGGAPDPLLYATDQYWDITQYDLPSAVVSGTVRLVYQTASKEYITFLRDNNPNTTDPDNRGEIIYDLWEQTERSRPETMAEMQFIILPTNVFLPLVVH